MTNSNNTSRAEKTKRQKHTISITPEVWRRLKLNAMTKGETASGIIEQLIIAHTEDLGITDDVDEEITEAEAYGFCLSDLIQSLREEGVTNPQTYRVHHAISVGHIDKPKKDTAGRYVFTDDNMTQIREYLDNTPSAGRKSRE